MIPFGLTNRFDNVTVHTEKRDEDIFGQIIHNIITNCSSPISLVIILFNLYTVVYYNSQHQTGYIHVHVLLNVRLYHAILTNTNYGNKWIMHS